MFYDEAPDYELCSGKELYIGFEIKLRLPRLGSDHLLK
jgi:hypothetical protein